MEASKSLANLLLALGVCACLAAQDASGLPGQSSSSSSSSSSPAAQSSSGQSSSKPSEGHRSAHHIQVPDEDSPTQPPELTEAEAAIEKQDYAGAEPLLRKLVERDATSYVGWFDLGFVENALGNVDGSIAAYRKSVEAKPDVFESNLNLGLQLAKTGQPGSGRISAGGNPPETHQPCCGGAIPGMACPGAHAGKIKAGGSGCGISTRRFPAAERGRAALRRGNASGAGK